MRLKALFINCTLKRSPEVSNTSGLADLAVAIMERNGVTVETIRAVDHQIAAGVYPDMTESFDLLADDVLAAIDALSLDRPLIAGISEGATTATIVGIRSPDSVRAIVNHAGYDFFNPGEPSFTIMRQILGGSPQATEADPDAEAGFAQSPEMQAMFELSKADQDGAQGEGYWREYLRNAFHLAGRRVVGTCEAVCFEVFGMSVCPL